MLMIVSLVNDLVNDKLKNLDKLDLSLQGNSTSSNLVNVGNEDDTQIMSTKETIIEPEVIESKEESEKIDQDNIDDHKKNPDAINLPENMIEDIKNVIINIAGRMLKPMFDSDGFYYTYKPGEFILYLKDDFYGIFVQTKTEEIGKSLGEIFSREISFSLGDYKDLEKSSQKKTSELESESQTSTEVDNIEETLDVEEKLVSINSSDEDILDESKNIIKNDGDTPNIEKNAEIYKLKEIFGEELIIK